jgi:hypothetical protein
MLGVAATFVGPPTVGAGDGAIGPDPALLDNGPDRAAARRLQRHRIPSGARDTSRGHFRASR